VHLLFASAQHYLCYNCHVNILMVYFLHRPDISANEGASVTARKNGCPSSPWCCQRVDKHRATSTVTKDLRNSSSHMCHVTVASGWSLDVLWTEWLFLSVWYITRSCSGTCIIDGVRKGDQLRLHQCSTKIGCEWVNIFSWYQLTHFSGIKGRQMGCCCCCSWEAAYASSWTVEWPTIKAF